MENIKLSPTREEFEQAVIEECTDTVCACIEKGLPPSVTQTVKVLLITTCELINRRLYGPRPGQVD
jgi:hypothetical protein